MWHWNWRSFFRIQVVTAVLLVMAYGVLIVATFFMASFSAASTGTQRAVSEVERAAGFLMAVPFPPQTTARGNIPLSNLLIALAGNAAFWAVVGSAVWAALFTALLGFFRRRVRSVVSNAAPPRAV
jgi:hypothetical protein